MNQKCKLKEKKIKAENTCTVCLPRKLRSKCEKKRTKRKEGKIVKKVVKHDTYIKREEGKKKKKTRFEAIRDNVKNGTK